MKKIAVVLAMSALLLVTPCVSYADHWHGDINHFHEYDMERWHSGYWANRFHDGRNGWWWVVGGTWYFYPQPVYPYPNPYVPPVVVVPQPVVTQYYWYCQNPAGYYPYVPACYAQWQAMPAATMVVPQTIAPQPQPAIAPEYTPQISQRDADDRQLNTLAAEFYAINPTERGALEHLKNLKVRVEAFRQSLFKRNYNAMDISQDTESLEHRIAEKKAQILNRDDA